MVARAGGSVDPPGATNGGEQTAGVGQQSLAHRASPCFASRGTIGYNGRQVARRRPVWPEEEPGHRSRVRDAGTGRGWSQLAAHGEHSAVSLELNKIAEQTAEMGRVLANRAQHRRQTLPAARELLRLFATDQATLRQVAESETGRLLRCAMPGDEKLDSAYQAPAMPDRVCIVAADGSQIYPDRHGLAFFYAINIGTIVYHHGSGRAPVATSQPTLHYSEDEVYPEGRLVSADMVGAERTLAEAEALVALAVGQVAGPQPVVALTDGPLLIWLQRAAIPEAQQARILEGYLACLDAFRRHGIAVAGHVSRPHSAEVTGLLYLAHLDPDARSSVTSMATTPFRGLTDRALFGFLQPGERSALFVRGTAANLDFARRGHSVFFFYLNTGSDMARVEVPEWIAREGSLLDLMHATLWDQCQFNEGYPYVLTRADEQAVIHSQEREALQDMIQRSMAQAGLPMPELSRKAQQKQVARWRRR